ncbi:MAG: DinB family protein [Acidobacteriota bacterium]
MHTNVAGELIKVVEASYPALKQINDTDALVRPEAGKWSKKEILGHLIDSAVNNHHRFVRAQQLEELTFPRYEQEEWVNLQGYQACSWQELIELWRLYNRQLAHVMRLIRAEKLAVMCKIGPYEPVSLGYLVADYLAHLKHHLNQIGVA